MAVSLRSSPTDVAPSTDEQRRSRRRAPGFATLFSVAFAVGGWRAGLSPLSDNSFLWHLRTGRWILDNGFPHGDIYSYTAPGTPWVVQSWLAEIAYAIAERALGGFGIRVLVATLAATIACGSFRLVLRLTRDRMRAVGVALVGVGASFTLWSERPLLFGLVGLVALLWIVEVPDSRLGRRPLVAVPIVVWLWAQCHGSFALGAGYLGLHILGRILDDRRVLSPGSRERALAGGLALGLAAAVANPYGWRILWFPVHLLGRGEVLSGVVEWRRLSLSEPDGVAFAAFSVLLVGAVAWSWRGGVRPSRRDVLVAVPFLVLAVWARRNVGVAPLVLLPIVARALRSETPAPDSHPSFHRPVLAGLLSLAVLWTAMAASEPAFDLESYPVAALQEMREQDLLGRRLLTDDGWAGLVIEAWGPEEQLVFVDDRFDMYPLPVLYDFIALDGGSPGSLSIIDRYAVDVVLWPAGEPLDAMLAADARWRQAYADADAVVYVRG